MDKIQGFADCLKEIDAYYNYDESYLYTTILDYAESVLAPLGYSKEEVISAVAKALDVEEDYFLSLVV